MRIEIPLLPPPELNPNWRGHWAKKHRATQNYRATARVCAIAARSPDSPLPVFKKARVSITLVIPDRRYGRDPDNALASVKPAIDGCVDAGIISDDSDKYLTYQLPIMYEITKQKPPATVLEFEEEI